MKRSRKLYLFLILAVLAAVLLFALIAPSLTSYDPYKTNMKEVYQSPSAAHPLGTDNLGRDELSRLLTGLRPSLYAACAVVAAVLVGGTLLGVLAGYFEGWLDKVIMWLVTCFQAFPGFLLAVVIAGFLGGGLRNACLSLILVYWTTFARLARGIVMTVKKQDYIRAAVLGGSSHISILFVHILPNILAPMLVTATAEVGSVIISMAGLSFLGLSSQRPTAEWGVMLSEAQELIRTYPPLIFYVSAALVLLVLVFNLIGDALRDWCDTRVMQMDRRSESRS